MTYETNNKTVLILDSRFSGLEQDLEKDLIAVDGLLEGLSIDVAASELELNSLDINSLGKQFDIILIGEFENKIKDYILKLNNQFNGEKVFLYAHESTSNNYLNFAKSIIDIIQRLDELSYNSKEMALANDEKQKNRLFGWLFNK
jgi:hypothetical protein